MDDDAPLIDNNDAPPTSDKRPQTGNPPTDEQLAHTADNNPLPTDNDGPAAPFL